LAAARLPGRTYGNAMETHGQALSSGRMGELMPGKPASRWRRLRSRMPRLHPTRRAANWKSGQTRSRTGPLRSRLSSIWVTASSIPSIARRAVRLVAPASLQKGGR